MLEIYHRVNCKSSFVIYLLDLVDNISISAPCNIQDSGKSETSFNIRLNNLRKDVKNPNAIPACKDFNLQTFHFNNHRKSIIK